MWENGQNIDYFPNFDSSLDRRYTAPLLKLNLKIGLRGAKEVDEAEDYEAPGSNPGKELLIMKMCFSIRKAISNSLHRAARSGTGPTPSSDICERHMLVT